MTAPCALDARRRARGGRRASPPPPRAAARLREVLAAALRHGREELAKPRSGYEAPVEVGVRRPGRPAARRHARRRRRCAPTPRRPASASGCSSPPTVATLVDLACPGPPAGRGRPGAARGRRARGGLLLAYPRRASTPAELAEFAPVAFEEHVAGDRPPARRRARAPARRARRRRELREPIGAGHPLRVAEAEARLRRPSSRASSARRRVLALLGAGGGAAVRPHEDPDPARRVARRILQRLDGMGKWGGYHTDFAHLARGFAGNERALAQDVGRGAAGRRAAGREALGRPAPRVPQPPPRGRHPRVHRDAASAPPGLRLPATMIGCAAMSLPGQVATHRQDQAADPRHARQGRASCARRGRTGCVHIGGRARPLGPDARRGLHGLRRPAIPTRSAIVDEARHAHLPADPRAHQRARARAAQDAGIGPGRRRGDHVPQPPRLHRGRRRVLQARRQRAVPQHRVLQAAADRRARARGPRGARLRRGVRRAARRGRRRPQALHRLARARARSPATSASRT